MAIKNNIRLALVTAALVTSQAVLADAQDRRQAKRIHDRLTGVNPTTATIDAMEATLDCSLPATPGYPCDGTGHNAARYAIETVQHNANAANPNARSFYNVTLKNMAAPWTNEAQTVFADLNDYSATFVGLVRDGGTAELLPLDFRAILHADIVYVGNNTPAYSMSDNDHYSTLEGLNPAGAGNLSDRSILSRTTQSSVTANAIPTEAAAGIMTSRAAARAFFPDGTNRAMFRFTLMNHLCTDLEPLKDVTRIPDRVRQDVSRSPGGDSRIFLNSCVGCHAGMDGMAGAFAFYDWDYTNDIEQGSLLYTGVTGDVTSGSVTPKHLINENSFPDGYITTDSSWINYWRNGQNALLGWTDNRVETTYTEDDKGHATGFGAKSMGEELANSDAFAECQVDKVFETVCLRGPSDFHGNDRVVRDQMVLDFKGDYNLREVFVDAAAHCKGN